MPPTHDDAQCYCLHCLATVNETDEACSACGASFAGSGAFDRIHGPRPSATFRALFAPPAEPALPDAIGLVAA